MKEVNAHTNKKLYYSIVSIVIVLMIMGLLIDNQLLYEFRMGYISHGILIIILSLCFLLYPKYSSHAFRMIMMIVASVYFYTLFFLYPETSSTFIYLCLIPAFSILFFDSKLFYFSSLLNSIFIMLTFSYIMLFDKDHLYSYIEEDLVGNVINFIGSQVIIYFIFYLSYGRVKKLQLYYEQLQQAERLKTTGQLAAAVAHEIRNPLTVVSGFLQIYEKDPAFSDDAKRHFTLMIDELNTAEGVISQFLAAAKPNKDHKTESVNVKTVLQSVTDILHSYGLLHNNRIELNIVDDYYIAANPIELKQLFINLIKNAIEASKVGDSVIVCAGKRKDCVEITVIDEGQGMSEKEMKSLGTPFYSLKSKGTGLGMMICFSIVEKYKGTIGFQSAKGEGTTVTITFPLV